MPLNLDIKRKFTQNTARVKAIDFHPKEQWFLTALYSGHISIWNIKTDALIKSIEVSPTPIRTARFFQTVPWIIAGCDDKKLHVVNYTTGEHLQTLQGHVDYIRSIAMHPTLAYFLTASDDSTIKLWDYTNKDDIQCVRTYTGHRYFVMQVVWSPHDANMFATASLDKTLKVWNINNVQPSFTLNGHTDGVNCLAFYPNKDKPYLISGADDCTIKVWDYQTQTVITTLSGHSKFITSVMYHPSLPIFFSGSEDFCVRIWHSHTYQCEQRLFYNLDRNWCIGISPRSNHVVLGYDDGVTVIKMGKNHPLMSIDQNGRVVFAETNSTNVLTGKIKIPSLSDTNATALVDVNGNPSAEVDISSLLANKDFLQQNDTNPSLPDGTKLSLTTKELGTLEKKPTTLQHSPGGKNFVVCDGTDYIIYTALAMNPLYHGAGQELVWGDIPKQTIDAAIATASSKHQSQLQSIANKYNLFYAVRESATSVQIYADNEVLHTITFDYDVQQLFGGTLLAIRGEGYIDFYDWITATPIHRIDAHARSVQWSNNGQSLAIITDTSLYLLKYDHNYLLYGLEHGLLDEDEIDYENNQFACDLYDPEEPFGIENSFDIVFEYEEKVRNGLFVNNCFVFITSSNKIQYLVQDSVLTVTYSELSSLYIVGYLNGYILCVDKACQLYLYSLPLSMLMFQTMVVEHEIEQAMAMIKANLQGTAYQPTERIAKLLGFDSLSITSSITSSQRRDQRQTASEFGDFGFDFDTGAGFSNDQQQDTGFGEFSDSFGFDTQPTPVQKLSTSTGPGTAFVKLQPSSLEKLATFLEQRGLFNEALQLCQDEEHKFNLCILANNYRVAISMLRAQTQAYVNKFAHVNAARSAPVDLETLSLSDTPLELTAIYEKWKQIGDIALTQLVNIPLAQYCYTKGKDYPSLLFLFALFKDTQSLSWLAQKCTKESAVNIAFYASMLANEPDTTISILLQQKCYPEAALFSRTYSPSNVELILPYWKNALAQVNQQLSDMIISPPLSEDIGTPMPSIPGIQPYQASAQTATQGGKLTGKMSVGGSFDTFIKNKNIASNTPLVLPKAQQQAIAAEAFPHWSTGVQAELFLKQHYYVQNGASTQPIKRLTAPAQIHAHIPPAAIASPISNNVSPHNVQPLQPPPSHMNPSSPVKSAFSNRVPSSDDFSFHDPTPAPQFTTNNTIPNSFAQTPSHQQPSHDDFGFATNDQSSFEMPPAQPQFHAPMPASQPTFAQPPQQQKQFQAQTPPPQDDFGFSDFGMSEEPEPVAFRQAQQSHQEESFFGDNDAAMGGFGQNDFGQHQNQHQNQHQSDTADSFEQDLAFFDSPANNNISQPPTPQAQAQAQPFSPFGMPLVKHAQPQHTTQTRKPAVTTFVPTSESDMNSENDFFGGGQFNATPDNNTNDNNTVFGGDSFGGFDAPTTSQPVSQTSMELPPAQPVQQAAPFAFSPPPPQQQQQQQQQQPIPDSQPTQFNFAPPPAQTVPNTFSAPTFQSPQQTTTIAPAATTATPVQFQKQQQQQQQQPPQAYAIPATLTAPAAPAVTTAPVVSTPQQQTFAPVSPLKLLPQLGTAPKPLQPLQPLQPFKPLTSPGATSTTSAAPSATPSATASLPGLKPLQPLQPLKPLQPLQQLKPLQPLQPLQPLKPLQKP